MNTEDKPLIWLHGEIKTPPFSPLARIEAGVLLRRLQQGHLIPLPHSRPMPSIGPRCHELRVRDIDATWRIVYRLDSDAVIIGEVFSKKTTKTPKKSSTSAKNGFKNMMNEAKKKRLIEKGWKVGGVEEFLQLSPDEAAYVELRLKLSDSLRAQRKKKESDSG